MNLLPIIVVTVFVSQGLCSGNEGCQTTIDVIAVVDGSESIDSEKFSELQKTLKVMVMDLKLQEHDTRFGLILYSSSITKIIPFSSNEQAVFDQIDALEQPMEGTQTHMALNEMNRMFRDYGRQGIPKVGIVLTDGLSKNTTATRAAAQESQNMHINIFAVSTNKEVDRNELVAISGSENRVLTVDQLADMCPHLKILLQACLDAGCKDYVDVVAAIDGSDSITRGEFQTIKEAVKTFFKDLSVENTLSRLSVVLFSSNVSQVIDFTNDTASLIREIDSLQQPRDGTNIGVAIAKLNSLFKENGRSGVPKIGVVITDGYSRNMTATAHYVDEATKLGINMFSIGVSDRMHSGELATIASHRKQSLVLDRFSRLSNMLMEDVRKACEDAAKSTASALGEKTTRRSDRSIPTTKPNTAITKTTQSRQPKTSSPSKTTKSQTNRLIPTKPSSVVDPMGLCDECTSSNGVGFQPMKNSCQKFVQCRFEGDELVGIDIKDCPLGLFWDQDKLTCNYPSEVDCKKDPCFGKSDGDYAHPTNCREFYQCVDGISFEKCCLPGEGFASSSGQCQSSNICQDPCKWGNPETGECTRREIADKTHYEQKVGDGWIKMKCGVGSLYNKDKCGCLDLDPNYSLPTQSVPVARACEPVVYLPFNTGTYDESGNFNYIQNNGVSVEGGVAYFDGQSGLRILRFSNADFGKVLTIRLKYKLDGAPGNAQAVVTNGDCGDMGSISIVAQQSKTIFGLAGKDNIKTTTEIDAGSDWNEVVYKVAGGELSTSVNGKMSKKMVEGIIVRRHCGLQIGRGEGLENFKGWIDELSVYMCSI